MPEMTVITENLTRGLCVWAKYESVWNPAVINRDPDQPKEEGWFRRSHGKEQVLVHWAPPLDGNGITWLSVGDIKVCSSPDNDQDMERQARQRFKKLPAKRQANWGTEKNFDAQITAGVEFLAKYGGRGYQTRRRSKQTGGASAGSAEVPARPVRETLLPAELERDVDADAALRLHQEEKTKRWSTRRVAAPAAADTTGPKGDRKKRCACGARLGSSRCTCSSSPAGSASPNKRKRSAAPTRARLQQPASDDTDMDLKLGEALEESPAKAQTKQRRQSEEEREEMEREAAGLRLTAPNISEAEESDADLSGDESDLEVSAFGRISHAGSKRERGQSGGHVRQRDRGGDMPGQEEGPEVETREAADSRRRDQMGVCGCVCGGICVCFNTSSEMAALRSLAGERRRQSIRGHAEAASQAQPEAGQPTAVREQEVTANLLTPSSLALSRCLQRWKEGAAFLHTARADLAHLLEKTGPG